MMSGCLDHSAIWSRTKICRRNCSSLAWACEMRSGSVPQDMLLLSTVSNSGQGIEGGDPCQIVDGYPLVDRVLTAGTRSVRDGRHLGQRPKAIAVVHKRFHTERQHVSTELP